MKHWSASFRFDAVNREIDIAFNFTTDAGGGDPDRTSPTLRRYHNLLWSKPLPDGTEFTLDDTDPYWYLRHSSDLGEFFLASDSIIHTFRNWEIFKPITTQIDPAEMDRFYHLAYTIGGMLVFPGNSIDRKMTINGARGCHPRIRDRFDLTLECIRRHYAGERSGKPLEAVLDRYADFFALFGDFTGYIDFFLLQDLVADDYSEIRFFTDDFDDFASDPLPRDLLTYRAYLDRSIAFINARNQRIQAQPST